MMQRKKKKIKTIFTIGILFVILILTKTFTETSNINNQTPIIVADPFTNVKKYSPQIEEELAKYDLEKYTVVLIALMQQESRGEGGDPMQASESAGLEPNEIDNPKESIKQGVQYFQRVVQYGNEKKVDFPTILQSYNMGLGYINYIAEHGGKHSEALAKKFSLIQVKKNPNVFDCGGNKNNFRYPYCFGDFTYSSKVSKNIELISDRLSANVSEQTSNAMGMDYFRRKESRLE